MAPLHSLVVVDGPDVWLEALAPAPNIELNGRPTVESRIVDGDHIRIGSFDLVAHVATGTTADAETFQGPVTPEQSPTLESAGPLSQSPFTDAEARQLSAAELVERIDVATQMVNEFERRQRLGMEALLDAVERRAELHRSASSGEAAPGSVLPMAAAFGPTTDMRGPSDLESLVMQLSRVVDELESRFGVNWHPQAGYLEGASPLLVAHDRLSRQVELLLGRVASLNAVRSDREPTRAIA